VSGREHGGHRWVGGGEYGDSTHGFMCGDCGADYEDTTDDDEPCPASICPCGSPLSPEGHCECPTSTRGVGA
jgi:hypothetical protein